MEGKNQTVPEGTEGTSFLSLNSHREGFEVGTMVSRAFVSPVLVHQRELLASDPGIWSCALSDL